MKPELIYTLILAFIVAQFLFAKLVDYLNLKALDSHLPAEFADVYDDKKYEKSQAYLRVNTRFGGISSAISTCVTVLFLLLKGPGFLDRAVRSWSDSWVWQSLAFVGVLYGATLLLAIPFSAYRTFVIEEQFGFNKTTVKTFILDFIKSLLLTVLIGVPVYLCLIWFFRTFAENGWLLAWVALTLFSLVLVYVAPVWIMPLFNKFTPLEEEGELNLAIRAMCRKANFTLKGVYTMDGSKRSSKSNAFFTGFGKNKKIALFDTLIEKHTTAELVAVLAHEIGHYKKKHIFQSMALSFLTSAMMLYLLGLILKSGAVFAAFGVAGSPVYAGLFIFGFIFSPISFVISVFQNILSRKNEYAADRFAAEITGEPMVMVDALKKLSADNLSNLTPHPLKVFLEYSHPPVLQRIAALISTREVVVLTEKLVVESPLPQ
ncbi:MAG: M48 family metallopeptidase [Kiritimatiellae bacterium]|nr:M48 family metallopeptidase [Kiritimatiellia bacterium]